jgi:hypothetical protein
MHAGASESANTEISEGRCPVPPAGSGSNVLEDPKPGVRDDPPGSRYQFERVGYFCSDVVESRPDALVFNRTVTLRDT